MTVAAPPTPEAASSAGGAAIADPAPLGLAAFAGTTFVLSCFNANLISATLAAVVIPLALFYGGLAQLLAGMWEFRKGNTFGATAFTSYGAFWLSYAVFAKFIAPGLPADTAHKAVGLYLLIWAVFTIYMVVPALKVNGSVLAVFVALALTFLVLAIGEFANSTGIGKTGGWLGLITAVLAWYASFAAVSNATWKRAVLPTWPLS
jgi:uncharacterized protein